MWKCNCAYRANINCLADTNLSTVVSPYWVTDYSKTYLSTHATHNCAATEQTAEMDDMNLRTTQKREWTSWWQFTWNCFVVKLKETCDRRTKHWTSKLEVNSQLMKMKMLKVNSLQNRTQHANVNSDTDPRRFNRIVATGQVTMLRERISWLDGSLWCLSVYRYNWITIRYNEIHLQL